MSNDHSGNGMINEITREEHDGDNNAKRVNVISMSPGTGVTDLGKQHSSLATTTDVGVALLAVRDSVDVHDTDVSDGEYGHLSITDYRELRTRDQRALDLANCNTYTEYTALSNDTINIANSTNHVFGVGALSFDKTNGADNTVFAGVSKTLTSIDLSEIFEAGGFVGLSVYLSSLTNVVNVFLRIGTSASHYNCWTWPVADLTAAKWLNLRQPAAVPDYSKNTGNGWNPAAVTYVAFGVEFSAQDNALAGILFDHVHIVGGRVTATDLSTAVTTNVNTANINVARVSNSPTGVAGNGVVGTGTLRVTVASDSTGTLGIKGNVTLSDAKTYIGLVSVSGAVGVSGNVTLADAKGYIGLVTVGGMGTVTLADPKGFIGLVTVGGIGTVTLADSKTFIGLVTANALAAGTTKTLIHKNIELSTGSIATVAVATGTWKMTNLLINSDATVRVSIKSGATYLTGNASIGITLNPGGGWVETGSPFSPTYYGLAANQAIVVEKLDMTGTSAKVSGKFIYFEE